MIYQIKTYNDLCLSKSYFKTMDEVKKFLKKVVEETEVFRKSFIGKLPNGWRLKVSIREIENSIHLIKIDESLLPQWETILGPPKQISPPNFPGNFDV